MYQYRGTIHDLHERVSPEMPSEEFDSCGTMRGYKRHIRNSQEACAACKGAKREQSRHDYAVHRARNPTRPKVFNPDACGTPAGYARHNHHNVPACDACKAAFAEYHRDYRAKKKVAA